MSELLGISSSLSLLLQTELRIERTQSEIAEALMFQAGLRLPIAITNGKAYLAGELPLTYLVNVVSPLLAD